MTTVAALAIDGGRPVRDSFLPFHQPSLGPEEEASVLDTVRSGWITTGPKTKAFKRELASYVGARHAVAVNSCTAALHLALEAIGVGAGDEVITSPITFASTANVVVHRKATPVFADAQPDTVNLDPAALEEAITARTKAVIPVHLAAGDRLRARFSHDGTWRSPAVGVGRCILRPSGCLLVARLRGERVGLAATASIGFVARRASSPAGVVGHRRP